MIPCKGNQATFIEALRRTRMGKILKLGILAGAIGGTVYTWKKVMGSEGDYGDLAAEMPDAGSSGGATNAVDKLQENRPGA